MMAIKDGIDPKKQEDDEAKHMPGHKSFINRKILQLISKKQQPATILTEEESS